MLCSLLTLFKFVFYICILYASVQFCFFIDAILAEQNIANSKLTDKAYPDTATAL